MAVQAKPLVGHQYEQANVCAECRGPLRDEDDGHYHTRAAAYGVGAEPVCCECAGHERGTGR